MTTPYDPKPLDTSAVPLPPSLAGLLERLAENTHEVWARQRVAAAGRPARRATPPPRRTPDSSPTGT